MLSDELRKIRQKTLLSQTDFAKAIGVSYSTINRWETGKSKPNIAAMRNIKAFCEQQKLSYETIENEWLKKADSELR